MLRHVKVKHIVTEIRERGKKTARRAIEFVPDYSEIPAEYYTLPGE
eukprot:COSAG01_NODE_453_length_16866_cov_30.622175_2_plen_46_part_00